MRDNLNREYSSEWLQYDRPQPMYSSDINSFYDGFYQHNPVHDGDLDQQFRERFDRWMGAHQYSIWGGLDQFPRRDIINGCTQFIDDIYQRAGSSVVSFENDYKYHYRLNPEIQYATLDNLESGNELIISMPFPFYGDVHPDMSAILDHCAIRDIPVHIDGAWISCIRDIQFDFDHPAIQTIGISLSKGGLGGNRIGLRYARDTPAGAVSIMNDFNMNSQALVSMGMEFMDHFGPEYFWREWGDHYQKVCADFGLTPTKAIHLARLNDRPVGVRPLLRFLRK
jgi:hypothetical protein